MGESGSTDFAHKIPLIPLVGRTSELAALAGLLVRDGPRLITLFGPGGVGKSRLALQAADAARGAFDRVALVELAHVREPALVIPTVSLALGVATVGETPLAFRLAQALDNGRTLLVLDNFEHVLTAAIELAELMARATGLHALVTSRVLLNIYGEQEFPIRPLRLPPVCAQEANLSRQSAIRYSAVALFIARARLADPAVRLTDQNTANVVAICRRLDGLPLALELAAAWLRLVSLSALRDLIEKRRVVLAGGPSDHAPRLRSMQATIAWSYDLLEPAEQVLFRRLSVFDNGFTLEMARQLMAGLEFAPDSTPGAQGHRGTPHADDVLAAVAALAAQSLVHRVDDVPVGFTTEPRFAMLETIRDFGQEQLTGHGESMDVQRTHARLLLRLAENAERDLLGPDERMWAAMLELELQNVRAAYTWLLEHDTGAAVRLSAALWQFWYRSGRLEEGEGYLGRALQRLDGDSPDDRGKGMFVWGALAGARGDQQAALIRLKQARELLRKSGDHLSLALTETSLGIFTLYAGDPSGALPPLRRAVKLYPHQESASSSALGAFSAFQLAVAHYLLTPSVAGIATLEKAAELMRASQSQLLHIPVLSILASLHWNRGEVSRAAHVWRDALSLAWEAEERWLAVDPLYGLAAATAARGDVPAAIELLGALDRHLATTGTTAMIRGVMSLSVLELAAQHLDPAEVARLRAVGANKPLALVVDALLREQVAQVAKAQPGIRLSLRERDVLRLLADGRSDPEIAAALFVSRRTVATHVASLFRKLGVHSRAAATAAAVRSGLV